MSKTVVAHFSRTVPWLDCVSGDGGAAARTLEPEREGLDKGSKPRGPWAVVGGIKVRNCRSFSQFPANFPPSHFACPPRVRVGALCVPCAEVLLLEASGGLVMAPQLSATSISVYRPSYLACTLVYVCVCVCVFDLQSSHPSCPLPKSHPLTTVNAATGVCRKDKECTSESNFKICPLVQTHTA